MAAKILGKLKGVIASACEPSRNGRTYTSHFWDAIFDSPLFKEGIKNRVMFGCMYHPEGEAYNQIHPGDESAICLTNVVKKGLEYIGTFDILPTRAGEVLKNLIDVGCVFGISSRGLNDYDTPVFDDPSTYELITFDIVAFPGIKSARLHPVTAVAESYGKRKVNKTKIMEDLNRLANEDEQAKKFINNTLKTKETELHKYICGNCGFETEMTDYEYDGSCPMCHEHHGEFGRAEESVKTNEASYGGAYDIADDEYFTKEDGMEAANEIAYQLEKEFPESKLEVMDMQLDNHSFYVTLTDKEGNEFSEEITLDMRKIRHPLDLTKKYVPALTERFIKQIKEYYADMQEVKEDFDTDTQVEDLPDAFNEIEDKDLLQYANIVTINDEGVPYFDDGRHGRLEVVTYPDPEFIKPGEKYLVNGIWYSDITNQYIVGTDDDWLLVN